MSTVNSSRSGPASAFPSWCVVMSASAGAEALGFDLAWVVAECLQDVGRGFHETGGAAQEAVRGEVGGPARGAEVRHAEAAGRAGPARWGRPGVEVGDVETWCGAAQ